MLPTGRKTADTYVTYWKGNWGYLCYLLEGKLRMPMFPTGRKTADTYVTYWKKNWGYLCYLLEGKLGYLTSGRTTEDTDLCYLLEEKLGIPMLPTGRNTRVPMLPTGKKTADTYVTYWKGNWGYLCYLLEGKLRMPMLPTGRKTADTYVTYWKEN